MNLPSDTPKLPKSIFLIGAVILITAAWFVWDGTSHPAMGLPIFTVLICVTLGVIVGVIPFFADYARRQDEALDNRQRALQALSVTVAAAAEQVSIAATGLNGIAEAAQDNFSKSERLAHQIQEKMAEFDARLAAARKGDSEAAARLESVSKALAEVDARIAAAKKEDAEVAAKLESFAKKMGKAVGELESAVAKAAEAAKVVPVVPAVIPELPPVIASRIVEIKPAVRSSNSPFEAPGIAPPAPAPAVEPEPAPAPSAESVPEAAAPAPAEPAPPPPAPRKRAPRKQAHESAAESLVLESPVADESQANSFIEISEPSISADGATRLLVTAYIGIGNRLFVRGEGPGLSWEKGIPLSFVSIGKWRWETNDASKAVAFKLYKNDDVECTALGQRSVEPGAQLELTASF